ncbi:MAG: hypothetical protein H2055_10275 [Sphingopyxis sp.]|nr:hypothetical protein [Sphingopyxis sp.]
MGMMRDLTFAAFAVLFLVACSSPSNVERGADRESTTAYYHSASEVDIAELGAAWFDGFVITRRGYQRVKAAPEEINAYMHGRSQASLFSATSTAQIAAVGR